MIAAHMLQGLPNQSAGTIPLVAEYQGAQRDYIGASYNQFQHISLWLLSIRALNETILVPAIISYTWDDDACC